MASVFTFDTEVPRVCSPWTTRPASGDSQSGRPSSPDTGRSSTSEDPCISKLDPEPQDGSTEYKLHLLLRPRRSFVRLSTDESCRTVGSSSVSPDASSRRLQPSSTQSRQNRLEHLTTQLLWRLQQSSPFHSSSTRNLVVPVLPDTSTKLDCPSTRAPLLPGLEESQGALYEIGVADDGTFIGLTDAEMTESLTNLTAMAASLGCKVDVLRKVTVGDCQWDHTTDDGDVETVSEKLWVVEALVSPDTIAGSPETIQTQAVVGRRQSRDAFEAASSVPYLSVALVGPSGAGKSSLLGTMATSMLDNGHGKSRLSLLRHRHEISTGMTSSVAQELIGFRPAHGDGNAIVNYAKDGVVSWNDIHMASDVEKLAFVSDLPGSSRFLKSTLRGIVGWHPQLVFLCVPANSCEQSPSVRGTHDLDLCLWYLDILSKLRIPVIIVITKLDIATKQSLKQTLSSLLTAIKQGGRKPIMLPPESNMEDVNLQLIRAEDKISISTAVDAMHEDPSLNVPLLLTSSVSGSGLRKLLAFLRLLSPSLQRQPSDLELGTPATIQQAPGSVFDILDVFEIPTFKVFPTSGDNPTTNERSLVLCGRLRRGAVTVGQIFRIGPVSVHRRGGTPDDTDEEVNGNREARWLPVRVISARNLRLPVKSLQEGNIGTIGIEPLGPSRLVSHVQKGMVLLDEPSFAEPSNRPFSCIGFTASVIIANAQLTLKSILAPGVNVVIYVNNVRAAAKVSHATCPQRQREYQTDALCGTTSSANHPTGHAHDSGNERHTEHDTVAMSFSFLSSSEWVEVGSSVLVMPGNLQFSPSPTSHIRSPHLPVFVGSVIDICPG